jgi:hypothetical protein
MPNRLCYSGPGCIVAVAPVHSMIYASAMWPPMFVVNQT